MIPISSCFCLWPICWSQVLSREWRCSGSSADRRCSDYIWVTNNLKLIAYKCATYISDLMAVRGMGPWNYWQYTAGCEIEYTVEWTCLIWSQYLSWYQHNWPQIEIYVNMSLRWLDHYWDYYPGALSLSQAIDCPLQVAKSPSSVYSSPWKNPFSRKNLHY